MKRSFLFLITAALLLVACSGRAPAQPTAEPPAAPTTGPTLAPTAEPTAEPPAGMANPASVYCEEQGGKLNIESRPDGGQFGVCYFMDNRQCEEWALLRGDCPVGGVKVTGYLTEAGRFCGITGGQYTVTEESPDSEQGTCTLPDGQVCEAQAYYEGACGPAIKE